jgi:predicted amidohydrolase YtcJ
MTPVNTPAHAHMIKALSRTDALQGLVDAHGHPLLYGYYTQLPLAGSRSIPEVIDRVEHFVKHNSSSLPSGAWIEGMGWDQNIWPIKEYPNAVCHVLVDTGSETDRETGRS